MARKRKKQSSHGGSKAAAAAKQSPEVREREALQALESGHWRDAIQALKALLKDDPDSERTPARRRALADAYAGRARDLTAKGMLKEAAVIWENRAALGADIPPSLDHGILRLRLGDPQPLIVAWAHPDALNREERQRVGEQLAAAVLSERLVGGDTALLEQLAEDDPIRRHAEPAQTALTAYCNADQRGVEAALAQLPFRSPYRALAILLKALVRAETEPDAAREMLARIDGASAFAPLRRAAELALLPDAELLAELDRAGPRQAELVAALRGWSKAQLELARALASFQRDSGRQQKTLQPLLKRYRDLLGHDWAQQASLRLMPRRTGLLDPNPPGWNALSGHERALIKAWGTEPEGDPWDVLDAWEMVAQGLIAEQRGRRDAPYSLEIAMVLRRGERRFKLLETEHPEDYPDSPETIAAEQLERSLQWDPDHRETYLRLITWYRRANRLKDARRVLSQAQERWPQDMALLEAAMETALASNAFKKAAGIARRMLAIDPINSSARRRLVEAHIEHAAKQIPKRRGDLARKELAEARNWTGRGAGLEPVRAQLDLLEGLVVLALEDPEQGKARLNESLAQRGSGVVAQVELMLAVDRLTLKQDDVAKWLGLKRVKVRDPEDLRAIIGQLRSHADQVGHFRRTLMERLAAALKGAPWKQLERNELEHACETLRAFRLNEARREAARAGLKRWPRTPMLEYHDFDSRYSDGGFPSVSELDKMEWALARAREAGEMRAAERLRELLQQFMPFGRMPGPPVRDDPWDDPFPPAPGGEGQDLGEGIALLLQVLEQMPLKQALEVTGMPKPMRKEVMRIAREQGDEAAVEMLKAMIYSAAEEAGELPKPQAGGGRSKARSADDPDGPPKQFDLF
ncbi:MAG: hypothetical protein GVY22_16450 [Gammaproteobacteria bacterium]|jgi:hypothetical protein|nr:hypothetical protein [Gammaproteobacteria bacterium]